MARFPPTWTSTKLPPPPPPSHFGQTPAPASHFWHPAEQQSGPKRPEILHQRKRGLGPSSTTFPQSGEFPDFSSPSPSLLRRYPSAPPCQSYPSHPCVDQSGSGNGPGGSGGQGTNFAIPQGMGASSQGVSGWSQGGGKAPGGKRREKLHARRQNDAGRGALPYSRGGRRGAAGTTSRNADTRHLGYGNNGLDAHSYGNRAHGMNYGYSSARDGMTVNNSHSSARDEVNNSYDARDGMSYNGADGMNQYNREDGINFSHSNTREGLNYSSGGNGRNYSYSSNTSDGMSYNYNLGDAYGQGSVADRPALPGYSPDTSRVGLAERTRDTHGMRK